MKYDINKDFSPREEQLALKGMIRSQTHSVKVCEGRTDNVAKIYGLLKTERLKLRLYERAREMQIEKYFDKETGDRAELCPVCGEYLEEEWSFCPACGQALNWEDD